MLFVYPGLLSGLMLFALTKTLSLNKFTQFFNFCEAQNKSQEPELTATADPGRVKIGFTKPVVRKARLKQQGKIPDSGELIFGGIL